MKLLFFVASMLAMPSVADAQSYYARAMLTRTIPVTASPATPPATPPKTYDGVWGVTGYSNTVCTNGTKTGTPITICGNNGVQDYSKGSCDPAKEPTEKVTAPCFRTCGAMTVGYYSSTTFVTDRTVGTFNGMTTANIETARKACEDYASVAVGTVGFSCLMTPSEAFVRTHKAGGSVTKNSTAGYYSASCS